MSPPPTRRTSRAPGGSVMLRGRTDVARANLLEQPLAGRVHEVEHLVEPVRRAVVGVGNVEVGRVAGGIELAQEVNLVARLLARREPAQGGQVFAVHSDEQGEVLEVLLTDRARDAPPANPPPA